MRDWRFAITARITPRVMTDTTKHFDAPGKPAWLLPRLLLWLFVAVATTLLCLLWWGGDLLIASDPLPAHVDAAVVLQGSISGEKARIAGAMRLLQRGVSGRALLSVPKESYWGQSIPPLARSYIETNYGGDLAARVDFCETGPDVNSTEQEASAISSCIQEHRWQSVAIVTSNYHTRRAGIIWRKTVKQYSLRVQLWIYGVPDPEFQPQRWWRRRLYAKTWFVECLKLVWTVFAG